MKRIFDYKHSEVLVPIISFYMEEEHIDDIRPAVYNLTRELEGFKKFLEAQNEQPISVSKSNAEPTTADADLNGKCTVNA